MLSSSRFLSFTMFSSVWIIGAIFYPAGSRQARRPAESAREARGARRALGAKLNGAEGQTAVGALRPGVGPPADTGLDRQR